MLLKREIILLHCTAVRGFVDRFDFRLERLIININRFARCSEAPVFGSHGLVHIQRPQSHRARATLRSVTNASILESSICFIQYLANLFRRTRLVERATYSGDYFGYNFFFFPLVFRTSTARRGQRDVRRDPEIARTERQPETDTSRDNYASGELGARIAGTGSRKLHCFLLYLPVHRSAIRDFSPLISLLFVFFSLSLLRLVVFHFASLVIETERRSDLGIFFLFRLKILGFPGVRDFNTSYFQRTRHGTCL